MGLFFFFFPICAESVLFGCLQICLIYILLSLMTLVFISAKLCIFRSFIAICFNCSFFFLVVEITLLVSLIQGGGRKPWNSINFVCAHDGFTLADLVTYNNKHNLSNGEDNNDGENHNNSWNCGQVLYVYRSDSELRVFLLLFLPLNAGTSSQDFLSNLNVINIKCSWQDLKPNIQQL